jgi:hypothetical protein
MRLRQKLGYIALGIVITLIGVSIPIQSQNPSEFTDLVVETLTVKKMLWVENGNSKVTISPEGILMREDDSKVTISPEGILMREDDSKVTISPEGILMRKGDNTELGIMDGMIVFPDNSKENGATKLMIQKDGIGFLYNGNVTASFFRIDPDNPKVVIVLAKEYWITDHEGNPSKSLD